MSPAVQPARNPPLLSSPSSPLAARYIGHLLVKGLSHEIVIAYGICRLLGLSHHGVCCIMRLVALYVLSLIRFVAILGLLFITGLSNYEACRVMGFVAL